MVSWWRGTFLRYNQFWQLLSQLETAGEEIEGEVLRSKALLEDGEDQHLSLPKNTGSSVIMKKQKADDIKVTQYRTQWMLI